MTFLGKWVSKVLDKGERALHRHLLCKLGGHDYSISTIGGDLCRWCGKVEK